MKNLQFIAHFYAYAIIPNTHTPTHTHTHTKGTHKHKHQRQSHHIYIKVQKRRKKNPDKIHRLTPRSYLPLRQRTIERTKKNRKDSTFIRTARRAHSNSPRKYVYRKCRKKTARAKERTKNKFIVASSSLHHLISNSTRFFFHYVYIFHV